MDILFSTILIILIAILTITIAPVRWKAAAAAFTVSVVAVLTSILAVNALRGIPLRQVVNGSLVTGPIFITIDPLSAWFILMINFTFVTGVFYGRHYMKAYYKQSANTALHWSAYLLAYGGLVGICVLQNSIAFLVAWEVMALSSFMLIIFEHNKQLTIKAGINFLIQSHVSILFLTIAFIFVAVKMKSYDFKAIQLYAQSASALANFILFFVFFVGFGTKAGFVPFHTWLPHAHPAAPAHISGIMSGVIIKIGIYGILRVLLLMPEHNFVLGIFIILISLLTGLYGILLAILQQNLKKLLAYSSIENIGIIGIGIGLGAIGLGTENIILATFGFAGALLHTLNHSLFKSLLFFGAGNIYQDTHTINMEQLGGMGKRLPITAVLFLMSSLAISGLPLFNGFISEFFVYKGIIIALKTANFSMLFLFILVLFSFVLIGGLAVLCYTKTYGIVFLGVSRNSHTPPQKQENSGMLIILSIIGLWIVLIGVWPHLILPALGVSVSQLTSRLTGGIHQNMIEPHLSFGSSLSMMGYAMFVFIGLTAVLYFWRKNVLHRKGVCIGPTWGCGYLAPNSAMQYTSNSFVRSYRKIIEPILNFRIFKEEIKTVFPLGHNRFFTNSQDKLELFFIDSPLRLIKKVSNFFRFLQNGKLQFYILYGVFFIILILTLPMIYEGLMFLIEFIKEV